MATKTALSLFESQGGVKIDEAKLSAALVRKIGDLDAMLTFLDHLNQELLDLNKEKRAYRILSVVSLASAVLGLILGILGLMDGVLGFLQVAVSLMAALALFGVVFVVRGYQRTAQGVAMQKIQRSESLSTDLEIRLDSVYDEVLNELEPVPRPPTFGKPPASAKQRVKRGGESD